MFQRCDDYELHDANDTLIVNGTATVNETTISAGSDECKYCVVIRNE